MCKVLLFMSLAILVICIITLMVSDKKKNITVNTGNTGNEQQAGSPQPGVTGNKNIVCLDAGHGGRDGGASNQDMTEKAHTLTIAALVKQYLEEQGITVIMTRESDTAVSLEERVAIANQSNACVLVSIHRNDYQSDPSVSGVEAWIAASGPQDARELAGCILNRLGSIRGLDNRGVKTGTMNNAGSNYYVNGHSKMASLILELGFITNDKDNEIIITQREAVAKAIAGGIMEYIQTLK